MDFLARDLRFAARAVRRAPGLAAIAILALALGIGMTTTMFSIIYGAVLRGLPFEASERIMHLEENNLAAGFNSIELPLHDFLDWRAQQRVFEDLGAYYEGTINLAGTERAERFDGAFMTASVFEQLRVRPMLGRLFRPEEEAVGAPQVVLLGHAVWRDRYRSDPGVVGRTVRANGEPATIIGVMPEGFLFPERQEVWLPLRMDANRLQRGEGQSLEVVGRLEDGVTLDRAAAHMEQVARRVALEHPETNEGVGAIVKPFVEEYIGPEERALLYTMLGAVFFVLLIACANVANLLLGRAIVRSRDTAVQAALGASRARIVLGFLAEPLVLALAGAALGVAIAAVSIEAFNRAIVDTRPPFFIDIRFDLPALAFVLGATLVATLASGVLPALRASRADLADVLKDEGRGSSSFRMGRLSQALVVAEVALSFALLVGAGLMIRSVVNLRTIDFDFATRDVFTARIGVFESEYPDDAALRGFHDALLERVRALPGVEHAALSTSLPALGAGGSAVAIEGQAYAREQDYPRARTDALSDGFLATLGARPLEGREFGPHDREGALPVALVNLAFAERHFPGESPIGRRIRAGAGEGDEPWRTIVGVVPDLFPAGIDEPGVEAFYVPLAQSPRRFASILARTPGRDPASLTAEARAAVAAVDPDVPIYFVEPLQSAIDRSGWFYRVFGTMFMILGAAALFLASVGLYGVMAFSVGRRTREVGIRMALGARPADVLRLVFRQGFLQLGMGVALGLALAFAVASLLQNILFGVEPRDPAVFFSITAVLLVTGAAAFFVPARRATAVDPNVALRYE